MNGNYTRFDKFGSKAILNLKDLNRIMNFWHHTVIVRSTLRSKAVAKLPLHVEPLIEKFGELILGSIVRYQ